MEFSQRSHGLVVGKPGIGKTYLIHQLRSDLISKNIPAFIVKVDKLTEASHEEITHQFSLSENWIDHFKKLIPPTDIRPVLIFDAFDAARDETKRQRVLTVIREAKKALSDKWNLLVSVRTYDADKSAELTRLFIDRRPDNDDLEQTTARKFSIPELSEDELRDTIENKSFLKFVVNEGNEKLNWILRVPFYLVLLDSIGDLPSSQLGDITLIKSEIQLLNKFWKIKVIDQFDSVDKERLISSFVKALVANKSLAISRATFLEMPGLNQPLLNYFLSENIIELGEDFGNKASFSHNIFFDYLAGRYALPSTLGDLELFMNEDTSRIFFLRPSFVYFFTNLWYNDHQSFWLAYWRFILYKESAIKLFARLTLNAIVANEYNSTDQLKPILEYIDLSTRNILIRYVLQSIRFQRKSISTTDLLLFVLLSERLGVDFLYDFGFLVHWTIASGFSNDNLSLLGTASRNLLNYTLTERQGSLKYFFERIGSAFGVELVCKTFASDRKLSADCLRQVLELLKEEDFQIAYFSNLTEYVKDVIPADPTFAAEIFSVIFGHTELSDKRTEMQASVLMTFSSNRQQDFNMCYYRLEMHFPLLVAKEPSLAIQIALPIVASRIIQRKLLPFEGNIAIELESFAYGPFEISYFQDRSVVWGENIYDLNEVRLIDSILSNIEENINAGGEFEKLVLGYFKSCQSAYCWKRIIAFACKYPALLKDLILPLYQFKAMVTITDTAYEMREYLASVVGFLTEDEIVRIEIFAFEHYKDASQYPLKMLLSQIPADRISTEQSRMFFKENERAKVNEKPVQFFSSSEDYTNDIFLREQGVDLEIDGNKELSEFAGILDRFSNQYLNDVPRPEEYEETLETIKDTFIEVTKVKSRIPVLLFNVVLRSLSQASAIIFRNVALLDENAFKLLSVIIKYSFEYISEDDKKQIKNSPLHGYGGTPRIEASEALVYLYSRTRDKADWELFKSAANDESIIVRFKAIKKVRDIVADQTYDIFYSIMKERLEKETNGFVYSVLLGNLQLRESENPKEKVSQAEEILRIIEGRREQLIKDSSFRENYADILLWLLFSHHSELAEEIMKGAIENVEFCTTLIFKTFQNLHPSIHGIEYATKPEKYQIVVDIMQYYLSKIEINLTAEGMLPLDFNIASVKDSFTIINQIILRIYFQLSERKIGGPQGIIVPASEENRRAFYFLIKTIFASILELSSKLNGTGLMTGPSAHYFIQSFNLVLAYDVKFILNSVLHITRFAKATNYTFDSSAIREIVIMTERLLADHRYLLQDSDSFSELIELLDIYVEAGWVDALELLWRLDEVFK